MDTWAGLVPVVVAAVLVVVIAIRLKPKCPHCGNRTVITTGVRDAHGEEARCTVCGHTAWRLHSEKPRRFFP